MIRSSQERYSIHILGSVGDPCPTRFFDARSLIAFFMSTHARCQYLNTQAPEVSANGALTEHTGIWYKVH